MSDAPSVQHCECGAEIYWARNDRSGKVAPIDAPTSADGTIKLFRRAESRAKFFRVLTGRTLAEARGKGIPLHTSHAKTCKQRV